MEKVYIKTSKDCQIAFKQAPEIIKALENYGGKNNLCKSGSINSEIYYIEEEEGSITNTDVRNKNILVKKGYIEIFLNKTNQVPLYL